MVSPVSQAVFLCIIIGTSAARIWTGKYIGVVIRGLDPCSSSPCLNSGTCSRLPTNDKRGDSFLCLCAQGFSGDRCDQSHTSILCATAPCQHGGSCIAADTSGTNENNNIICRCRPGFAGPTCQIVIEDNAQCGSTHPCLNGGRCTRLSASAVTQDRLQSTRCICLPGFTGSRCQIQSPTGACLSSPCQNGGLCLPRVSNSSFLCRCPLGWEGKFCEVRSVRRGQCEDGSCGTRNLCTVINSGRMVSQECVAKNKKNNHTINTTNDRDPRPPQAVGPPFPLIVLLALLAVAIFVICGAITICRRLGRKTGPEDCCLELPASYKYTLRRRGAPIVSGDSSSVAGESDVPRFYLVNPTEQTLTGL